MYDYIQKTFFILFNSYNEICFDLVVGKKLKLPFEDGSFMNEMTSGASDCEGDDVYNLVLRFDITVPSALQIKY